MADAQDAGNAGFVARYKAKYNGETPAYHAAGGYAAVQMLGAAVTR